MPVRYFKSTWGMTEESLAEQLKRIAEAGYDGVEINAPEDRAARQELGSLLHKYNLLFIGQQWTAGNSADEHKRSFEKQLKNNAELNPVHVNSHTGRDYFGKPQNLEILKYCNALAAEYGVELTHETHRGRFSFSLMSTAEYINELPELNLTADISHWCCVSESLLQEQSDILEKVFPRCKHIHARIGHEEGPQVGDPQAPEWKYAVEKHVEWWNIIIGLHRDSALFPVTVEFGPPNYMPTMPFSRKPVADLWETNLYMKEMLKEKLKID